jgi:hypothetical protein
MSSNLQVSKKIDGIDEGNGRREGREGHDNKYR